MHVSTIPVGDRGTLRIHIQGVSKVRYVDADTGVDVEKVAFIKLEIVDTSVKRHRRFNKYPSFTYSIRAGGVPCLHDCKARQKLGAEKCALVDDWAAKHWRSLSRVFRRMMRSEFDALVLVPEQYVVKE